MRRPLGVLAVVAGLAACAPSTGGAAGAAPEVTGPADGAAPASTQTEEATPEPTTESDECRVNVVKPGVSALRIQASAVRRGCVHPALLRIQVKRAVPGDDPVIKSGATRKGRITLKLPCEPGTYYAVATDYRGGTAKSKATRLTCVTPTPTPASTTRETGAAPVPQRKEAITSVGTTLENEVVRRTNAERVKGGCDPLKHDARLRRAAFGHSADMAENDYFDHDSQDGRDMVDRIRATGFTGSALAENIAMGQRSAAEVVQGWMNSDGHRQNIMNCSYTLIGVGAAKDGQGQIY